MATKAQEVIREKKTGVPEGGPVRQVTDFLSGNESAAKAASDIGFHVMGYFPITPSTEVRRSWPSIQKALRRRKKVAK